MPSPLTGLSSETAQSLGALMDKAGIEESALLEKFVRASGPGGQKVNKTSSAVYLKHLPTGEEVKIQIHRSQIQNRIEARQALAMRLLEQRKRIVQAKTDAKELKRRQNRPPSRRAKARNVEAKRNQSTKKQMRRAPSKND